MDRACLGCGAPLQRGERERNKRRWCSEACRIRTYRNTHPEYRARQAELAARRHAETYIPIAHDCECVVCGATFTARTSLARFCSDKCRFRQNYLGRRGRRYAAERDHYSLEQVAARDGWACGLCGEGVDRALAYPDPMVASIDHVTPLSKGGSDTEDNVQLAHLACNWRKGNRAA